jgi:hypothetical protein
VAEPARVEPNKARRVRSFGVSFFIRSVINCYANPLLRGEPSQ